MNWALTAVIAGGACLSVWGVLGVDYAWRLRRVLGERQRDVARELVDFVARARAWETVFAEGAQREWRDSAAALERILQRLDAETRLAGKVTVAKSLARLLTDQEELLANHPDSFPVGAPAGAVELRGALARVESSFGEYAATVADAAFLCTRFPLSKLASAAGLSQPER
ncbi:MAG: hypothetical protein JXA57_05240 [Armatimonadetes bacterium]|nr:hypothetical protein [Armatimonadota bacterium]